MSGGRTGCTGPVDGGAIGAGTIRSRPNLRSHRSRLSRRGTVDTLDTLDTVDTLDTLGRGLTPAIGSQTGSAWSCGGSASSRSGPRRW